MSGRKLTALIMCAALAASGVLAAAEPAPVAVVNGQVLSRAEFTLALIDTMGRATVDNFIEGVLIEQAAAAKSITASAEEVSARKQLEITLQLKKIMETSRLAPEEYRSVLERSGWTEEEVRADLEKGISEHVLRIRVLAEKLLAEYVPVTDEQVKRYYERTMGPRSVAAHILVPNEQIARALLARLKDAPVSWTEAVLRYSMDRASTPYKGRLVPLAATSPLGKAIAGLETGQLAVYEDSSGWHVVRCIQHLPAAGMSLAAVKDDLRKELYCRRVDAVFHWWVAGLNANATVVTNLSADPKARAVLGEHVVAFVNGQTVTVEHFGDVLVAQFGLRFMAPFIERCLIRQQAARLGVTASEQQVEERVGLLADAIFDEQSMDRGTTAQAFADHLREIGLQPEGYREQLAKQFVSRSNVHAMLLAEKIAEPNVKVHDEEVQRVYDAYFGDRIDCRRIIVETLNKAEEVRRLALGGASFVTLAQAESLEDQVWMHKGLIRGITAKHPYYPHIKDMKPGDVSLVFEHYGNFCVLKVVARHPAAKAPPLDEVRDEMRKIAHAEKVRTRIRAWLEKLKAESDIEIRL